MAQDDRKSQAPPSDDQEKARDSGGAGDVHTGGMAAGGERGRAAGARNSDGPTSSIAGVATEDESEAPSHVESDRGVRRGSA